MSAKPKKSPDDSTPVRPVGAIEFPAGAARVRLEVPRLTKFLKLLLPARGGALPVLGCVRLEVVGERLAGRMTNLDMEITATMPVLEGEMPALCVDAKMLSGVVARATAARLEMELTGTGELVITCGDWVARLHTLSAEDFPPSPTPPYGEPVRLVEMPSGMLRRMLELAGTCVSTDETRYVLNGVHVVMEPEAVRMESTDGRTLTQVELGGEWTDGEPGDCIVPRETVRALRALLPEGTEAARLEVVSRKMLRVVIPGGVVLWGKLIEGEFPVTAKVVPAGVKVWCDLDREQFTAMLNRGEVLADDAAVGVRIEPSGLGIVESETREEGQWRECHQVCATAPGEAMEFRANVNYLSRAGAPDCDTVRLGTDGPGSALLFRAREEMGPYGERVEAAWLLVVMPLKVHI